MIEAPHRSKRILVTGGLGVVGSTIARRLLAEEYMVDVLDADEAPRNDWICRSFPFRSENCIVVWRGRLEHGVVRDAYPEKNELPLDAIIARADYVIHCAASTGIPHSVLHPDDDWRSNVDATRVLLDSIRRSGRTIPTVVLSSVKPYKIPSGGCTEYGLTEKDVLAPDEPYAASKAAQSMLAMAYARSYNLPIVTFRCSNLYGPAPCHGPRHGWLTWFAISAAIGRPIEVQGTGEQTRDMLHADDVYAACMLALKDASRLSGRVFNLGGGFSNRISVADAASRCVSLAGGGEIRTAPARAMDDLHVYVSTGAFLRATGWRAQVNVEEGLAGVFAWAKANADELRKLYEGV